MKDKKTIKKILRIVLIIGLILITFFSLFDLVKGDKGGFVGLKSKFDISKINQKYYEIVLEPSLKIADKDVFVNEKGEFVREVPEVKDSKTDKTGKKEENKYNFEEVKKNTVDEEVKKYKIEKKAIKDNEDSYFNFENYERSVKAFSAYLRANGISGFNTRLDKKKGKIVFEIPQKKDISLNDMKRVLLNNGKFELKDVNTGKVYLTEKNIQEIIVNASEQYGVIMQIKFDEQGKKILEETSKKYAEHNKKVKENDPYNKLKGIKDKEVLKKKMEELKNAKKENDAKTQDVDIMIGGLLFRRTSFTETIPSGYLQLVLAKLTNKEEAKKAYNEAMGVKRILDAGSMSLKYNISSSNEMEKMYDDVKIFIFIAVVAALFVISLVGFVIFYGVKGLYASLVFIGLVPLLLSLINISNIDLNIMSILGIVIVSLIELCILYNILKDKEKNVNITKNMLKVYTNAIAVVIIGILFCFAEEVTLANFGRIIFLGLFIQIIYNYIFAKGILKK